MDNLATTTVVDGFLAAITARGERPEQRFEHLYVPGATLDAVVPGWRFHKTGPTAIAAEYAQWFNEPTTLDELCRQPVSSGEVIEYTAHWQENGTAYAARHVHVLSVDPGFNLIVSDHVWCGGRWDAALLADMAQQ